MESKLSLFSALIVVAVVSEATTLNTYQENIIAKVNEADTTWEAGVNFHTDATEEFFQSLVGTFDVEPKLQKYKPKKCGDVCEKNNLPESLGDDYPENFDARKKWTNCPTIGKIYDQGHCKSDWAISATSAIQDRICIVSNGTVKTTISAQQVISCCQDCGRGCKGGFSQEAWLYYHRRGIASGGAYNSNEGCQPYLKKPTGFKPNSILNNQNLVTPKCKRTCYNENYGKSYVKEDLHRGTEPSGLCCCGVKSELNEVGPVTTNMILFEDFLTYKSGIYQHVYGKRLGRISVKVIGYGMQNKKVYYLAVNSWSEKWGDKGTFKIWKEHNNCEFSDYLYAGDPIV